MQLRAALLTFAGVAGLALAPIPRTHAEEPTLDASIATAQAQMEAGEIASAADTLGRAAAQVHAADDLVGEQRLGRETARLHVEALRSETSLPDCIARLAGHLDAERLGVFVSAHSLVNKLLVDAVDDGDHRHIDLVVGVLRPAEATGKLGAGGAALLHLANAVALRRDAATASDWKQIEEHIGDARRIARDAKFCDLRVCIEIEAAETWRARGRDLDALRVLADGLELTTANSDTCCCSDPLAPEARLRTKWSVAVARRFRDLKGADALLQRGRRRTTGGVGGGSPTSDAPAEDRTGSGSRAKRLGGEGGARHPAGRMPSDAERIWSRMRPNSPIVTLRQDGAETVATFFVPTKSRNSIPRPNWPARVTAEPFTVSTDRHHVALTQIDLVGNLRTPGQTGPENLYAAWYYVADGETLTISRRGRVSIE